MHSPSSHQTFCSPVVPQTHTTLALNPPAVTFHSDIHSCPNISTVSLNHSSTTLLTHRLPYISSLAPPLHFYYIHTLALPKAWPHPTPSTYPSPPTHVLLQHAYPQGNTQVPSPQKYAFTHTHTHIFILAKNTLPTPNLPHSIPHYHTLPESKNYVCFCLLTSTWHLAE